MNARVDLGENLSTLVEAEAAMHPGWAAEVRMWRDRWAEMAQPAIPGSVALLHALRARGVPVFALTNFGVETFDVAVGVYPWLDAFDRRYVSGHLKVMKPDPEIYRIVEEDCGIAPGALLFADDRPDNVAAAAARGWRTHLFEGPEGWAARLVAEGLLTKRRPHERRDDLLRARRGAARLARADRRAGRGAPAAAAEIADTFLYRGRDTLLNRAAWIDGLGIAVKSATIFPGNLARGEPAVNGGVCLYSDEDGRLSAIIDFHLVTKWKTAGDSLLAASRLARPDSAVVLIVGAGTVARSLREAYGALFPTARFLIWNRTAEKAEALAAETGWRLCAISQPRWPRPTSSPAPR
jgi:2-haloacid dehalogenase